MNPVILCFVIKNIALSLNIAEYSMEHWNGFIKIQGMIPELFYEYAIGVCSSGKCSLYLHEIFPGTIHCYQFRTAPSDWKSDDQVPK